jgi:hypothetical protein
MGLQFKKIELYGTDLSQFELDRNPLTSGAFLLTHNESIAINNLLNNWINERNADNYRTQPIDFLISVEDAKELIHKLKRNIGYEKI